MAVGFQRDREGIFAIGDRAGCGACGYAGRVDRAEDLWRRTGGRGRSLLDRVVHAELPADEIQPSAGTGERLASDRSRLRHASDRTPNTAAPGDTRLDRGGIDAELVAGQA